MSDDGGPAFPVAEDHKIAADLPWTQGMSLRDWFAGQAMNAIIGGWLASNTTGTLPHSVAAKRAFDIADAMLDARKVP